MAAQFHSHDRSTVGPRVALFLAISLLSAGIGATASGCARPGEAQFGRRDGQGPGHRTQSLGLSPEEEYSVGRQAYAEILSKSKVEPPDSQNVRRVKDVGGRIVKAAEIEPLQREIGLHLKGYRFEWEFNVLSNKQVNAFCLPGGKVCVYSALLGVADTDDYLATVMAHEIAHALAHHASERVAREEKVKRLLQVANGALSGMNPEERRELLGILAAGTRVGSLPYDRQQESEADHIGLFLMTFAGYDPRQAIVFWEKMQHLSRGGHIPAILSDHPSDAKRIAQLQKWVPTALAGKKAIDEGRIAPQPGS